MKAGYLATLLTLLTPPLPAGAQTQRPAEATAPVAAPSLVPPPDRSVPAALPTPAGTLSYCPPVPGPFGPRLGAPGKANQRPPSLEYAKPFR